MKETLAVCTAHRVPWQKTQLALQALPCAYQVNSGVSDTALARNVSFASALRQCEQYEMFVFVDDDMLFTVADFRALVDTARNFNHPTSAIYMTDREMIAMKCIKSEPKWQDCRFLTGLGMLAISGEALTKLASSSEWVESPLGRLPALCQSGPYDGEWESEDYCFTRRLGGVIVAPIAVGHIKPVAIMPPSDIIPTYLEGS